MPKDLLTFSAGFLIQFGFIGVALLFLAAAWFTRSANPFFARTVATFGIAFLTIYGILNLSLAFFPALIVKPNSYLAGELKGVSALTTIRMRPASEARPPYVRIENDRDDSNYQVYNFMYSLEEPFTCFTIYAIYPPAPDRQENVATFNVMEVADLSGGRLVLAMDGEGGDTKISVKRSGPGLNLPQASMELSPLEVTTPPGRACGKERRLHAAITRSGSYYPLLLNPAFAQDDTDLDATEFARSLTSDDTVTRRSAREDLADQGVKAGTIIKTFVESDNYRLQLGATEALKRMDDADRSAIVGSLGSRLEVLKNSPDKTLSESARAAAR